MKYRIVLSLLFLKDDFDFKYPTMIDMAINKETKTNFQMLINYTIII